LGKVPVRGRIGGPEWEVKVRRFAFVAVLVVSGALLVGCTSEDPAPAVSTSPAALPTPTPTPTPSDAPADMSDATLGIVFEDTPDVTGPARSAHDAVAIFMKEFWRSISTGEVSGLIPELASADVSQMVADNVQVNAEQGYTVGGTMHYAVSAPQVDGQNGTATVCVDPRDALFGSTDGSPPQSAADVGSEPELIRMTLLQVGDDGRWMIQTFEGGGPC
jgi:hypothetical protein